jgi:hypothetical protein
MQARRGHTSPRTTARYTHLTPLTLDVVPAPITALMADRCAFWSTRMPEVADVWRRDGPEDLDRCGQDLRPRHRRALEALLACRTEVWGGQLWHGEPGGQAHSVYHSCRHRRGPQCPRLDTDAWLAARRQERLPVPYCHVVFPGPHARGERIRRHQTDLDDLMLRAAAPARITRAADPHDVGSLIGGLWVLHTWSRTLAYHPHGHCLVPAGGVSADRTAWRPARPSSLGPVHALSTRFRGLCLALGRQERPDRTRPELVWTNRWVVYGTPTVQGTAPVLRYWGRYVYRLALPTNRLRSGADGQVGFRSQDAQDSRGKTMTLPAQEVSRRFRPHVWPPGCHQVRYYGLWSPVPRSLRRQLQLWLAGHAPAPPPASPAFVGYCG